MLLYVLKNTRPSVLLLQVRKHAFEVPYLQFFLYGSAAEYAEVFFCSAASIPGGIPPDNRFKWKELHCTVGEFTVAIKRAGDCARKQYRCTAWRRKTDSSLPFAFFFKAGPARSMCVYVCVSKPSAGQDGPRIFKGKGDRCRYLVC